MKTYRNRNSGLAVITGKIKSISEDRMAMVITSEEFDGMAKVNNPVEYTVTSGIPYEGEYKPGFSVTAVGYPHGKGVIAADAVFIGNDVLETQDLAVVTGLVKYARLNEEKNQDGSPKMTRDGKPKKPHYDITIKVNDAGTWVDHIIRVYDLPNAEKGKKTPIEKVSALFSRFDSETNRIKATFVTSPGQEDTYTVTKNGKEYTNHVSRHMGYRFLDVEYLDSKEKTQGAPTAGKDQSAPIAPDPQPVNGGEGFDAEMDMDAEELFK